MSGQRTIAFQVIWRIENIKSWLEARDDTLYSPQFLAETLMNTRWKLRVSPNWQLAEKYISITLQRDIDDHPELIDLNYEISLLACDGSPFKSKTCMKKFAPKTVGHELNVKEDVILKEKNEAYLPEGVLTVCCKLWKWSTVSKGGQCSIQSVIGTKRINLDEKIPNFNLPSLMPVNFMIPSTDISRISLNIFVTQQEFVIQRKHVECKSLSWHSYKLFAVDNWGRKTEFDDGTDLTKTMTTKSASVLEKVSYCGFFGKYIPNNTLTLHLYVIYHPGVVSESVKSELPCVATDLENLKVYESERVLTSNLDCLHSSDSSDDEEGQSIDEDEHFDAAGKKKLLSTTLKEDLTSLYKSHLFCDTKLQTDNETFPAHKSVLSARSPVFYKMFTTDMKEKAGECICIPDIGSDTIQQMLQFIYTDCTGDLEMQSAKDLYVASDKYDIVSLKQRCLSFMKNNLCVSNVCEVLVLADMHHDKDLESTAQEYVLTYDKEVFCSDEWKYFMKKYGSLAAQVMYLKCIKE